jgi:uncharacterized membrane protein
VSAAADGPSAAPGAPWERLERASAGAADALAAWRKRALKAEAEITALRSVLEKVVSGMDATPGSPDELKRLRAENALLRSRTNEARTRVTSLMARLQVVEAAREP